MSKKTEVLGFILLGVVIVGSGAGAWFLGSHVHENRVVRAETELAPQSMRNTATSINTEFVMNDLPPDSKVEGFATGDREKGFIWVEGETAPYTFNVNPVMNDVTPDLNSKSQVEVEGTLKDYTITYIDDVYHFTLMYDSKTDSISKLPQKQD